MYWKKTKRYNHLLLRAIRHKLGAMSFAGNALVAEQRRPNEENDGKNMVQKYCEG